MDIHVIITFQSKPDRLDDFAGLLDQVKRELPQVFGCRAVRVFRHHGEPGCFSLLETWATQALHQAHIEQVISSGGWAHIAAHLASDPVSRYCSEV